MYQRIINFMLVIVMVFTAVLSGVDITAKTQTNTLSIGSSIYYGNYIQDKVTNEDELEILKQYTFSNNMLNIDGVNYVLRNGKVYKDAPIEWQILCDEGDCYTLLSKKVLEIRPFDDHIVETIFWHNSQLREWLNGTFLNSAFSQEEQDQIETTTLSNITSEWGTGDNPYFPEGNPEEVITEDKVYLLTKSDVQNSKFGFEEGADVSELRVAYKTQYLDDEESVSSYWLRGDIWSYGNQKCDLVYSKGNVGSWYRTWSYGVRPVIRVKKDAVGLSVTKPEEKGVTVNNNNYRTTTNSMYPSLSELTSKLNNFPDLIQSSPDYSIIIPGRERTNVSDESNYACCDNMVPQGVCVAGDYLLITAYCHQEIKKNGVTQSEHKPVVSVMNQSTKKYITTLVLKDAEDKCHVGAITYCHDNKTAYIADSTKGKYKIWKLRYSEIQKAVKRNKDVNQISGLDYIKVWDKPSFLCYYGGRIYIGTFDESSSANTEMKAYCVDGSTTKTDAKEKVVLPPQCQGAAIYTHNDGKSCTNYIVASCSYGAEKPSYLYIEQLGRAKSGQSGKSFVSLYDASLNNKFTFPNMSEDIEKCGDRLLTCFESAANAYVDRSLPVDRVVSNSFSGLLECAEQKKFGKLSVDYSEDSSSTILSEGRCGEQLTYVLYGDGTFYLSGQGDMEKYSDAEAPWAERKGEIKKLVIDADVLSVSEGAFQNCENLKEIWLSDMADQETTFSIGTYAFAGCGALEMLSLPERKYSIDANAFSGNAFFEIRGDAAAITEFCNAHEGISQHIHSYTKKYTVEATCSSYGYDLYECSCGETISENVSDKLVKHSYEEKERVSATCQNTGSITYECTQCGFVYTEEIPKSAPVTKQKVKKPGKVCFKSVKNIKGKKITLSWKKVNGTKGYLIQYSNKKNFKVKKSRTISKNSYTIRKLKKKKTYYIRVRAYKLSGKKKVYGAWSKVKKVKVF